MADRAAVILAAGVSSRMNTMMPKVLHEVCGRPMLSYVVDACRKARIDRIICVVGYRRDDIVAHLHRRVGVGNGHGA